MTEISFAFVTNINAFVANTIVKIIESTVKRNGTVI
jgi:hypothetical protein